MMNYTKSQDGSVRYVNAVCCWVHICVEDPSAHHRTWAVALAQLRRRFRAEAVR